MSVWGVAGAILASIGSAGAIVLALASWLGKVWAARILEKDRLHYTSELERFKNQLDRSTRLIQVQLDRTAFVGRVHFETEFKALAEIWAKVAAVRASMSQVRPMMDVIPENETPEQREARELGRLRTFIQDLNPLVTIVDAQSPFIPQAIFRKLEEIIQLARSEATEVQLERHERVGGGGVRDWFRRGREHNQQLQQLIAELSDLIRERLASLVVPPVEGDCE